MEIEALEKQIDYIFHNKELLKKAVTHTSYAYENKVESNEKLEFLGDSILEYISSDYLYNNYRKLSEGEMTKVRAQVVCEESLYKIAKKHNFSDFLLLGKSEIVNNGNQRQSVLADCVEAIIAAIYLDSGIEQTKKFILSNLKEPIREAVEHVGQKDYKTVLQEKLQENGTAHIEYQIIKEEGPDHAKIFTSEVIYNGTVLATGRGRTKKAAEMEAAKKALEEVR